jgi:hypothetical protein
VSIIVPIGPQPILQPYLCYACGRKVKDDCPRFLIDRVTDEVLDPRDPANYERGMDWPIGPECRRKYPGIEALAWSR